MLSFTGLIAICFIGLISNSSKISSPVNAENSDCVWLYYSKLNHPNIVTLIGARAYPPDYYFLYQLYEHGNLGDALHVSDWRPSLQQVMTIATQLG